MKCYLHHESDAVGVCTRCGQGVCDVCAVMIGGKIYCKTDADRVFGAVKELITTKAETISPTGRPVVNILASLSLFSYGLVVLLLSSLMIVFSLLGSPVSFFGTFYSTSTAASDVLIIILEVGTAYFVVSIVSLLAGVDMWRMSHGARAWALGGAVGNLALLLVFAYMTPTLIRVFLTPVATAQVAFSVFVFVLLGLGWDSFELPSLDEP